MAVARKGAARLATLTNDPATQAQVPKASLRRSPHVTSVTTVGVGGLGSSVGDGGGEATWQHPAERWCPESTAKLKVVCCD